MMRRLATGAVIGVALLLTGCVNAGAPTTATPAGAVPSSPASTTAATIPDHYDPARDPDADLKAALALSASDGKEVLIDFGADWCPDCRVLDKLFQQEETERLLQRDYHVVAVDVGQFDHNLDFAARYVDLRTSGIPALVVLAPGGRILAATNDGSFANARTMKQRSGRCVPDPLGAGALTPRRTALAVMAVALLTGGCATAGSGDPPGQLSGRLDDGGVAVVATLVSEPDGTWRVRATFAPQKTGYHLYSMDLPPDGVDGLGVPTTVAVLGSLRAAGSPTTDVPVKALRIPSLDVDLPVYPDGPVTVTVPVRRIGHGRAEVAVSYAACSPANCLAPVRDRIIALAPG